MASPYPTKSEIQSIFSALSTPGADFFAHVIDDVDWTIMGHSPMSGSYTNKHDFELKTLHFLGDKVLTEPLKMYVVNVIGGGGSEDTFAVEMKANADCRNGLKYNMVYCWIVTFNEEKKIKKVRAYLDTDLLTRAIEENR